MAVDDSPRERARAWLADRFRRAWAERIHGVTELAELERIAADESAGDYERLAAGLDLALAGNRAGIPVLRRVLAEPFFALTNSCIERGDAALGLALLGDAESAPLIRTIQPINGNQACSELALRVLADDA
jgi:hypothetical protein